MADDWDQYKTTTASDEWAQYKVVSPASTRRQRETLGGPPDHPATAMERFGGAMTTGLLEGPLKQGVDAITGFPRAAGQAMEDYPLLPLPLSMGINQIKGLMTPEGLGNAAANAPYALLGLRDGLPETPSIPNLPDFPRMAKTAKVKARGAYEGAKASADLNKSVLGAAAGEYLGQQLLGLPHYVGAEIGAGLPMIRGAIRGAMDAKVPQPPPIPLMGFPPSNTWVPPEPLPIRTNTIPEHGPTVADLRGAATDLRTKTPLPSRRTAPTADLSLPPEPLPTRTYNINTPAAMEQPPIPLRNIEPPAKIPPVGGTQNMPNIDLSHLGQLPEEYVSKIKSHNSPLNAAAKDAAFQDYLKSRGVTTKAQFDAASDFQHQEWNRESDALRGVKTRPMNADAKARFRLRLK